MCTCLEKNKINYQVNSKVLTQLKTVKVKNGWRRQALFRIEKLIREVGQDSRAKRMGICGNTIFVKVNSSNSNDFLFEPQLRCKDRVCPICNSYKASILSKKVEEIGKKMTNPHLLTVTASNLFRDDLKKSFENYKIAMRNFKRNKTWFKKYIAGGVEHIEVAKNKKRDWHIHSHILVDLKVARKVENMQEVNHMKVLDPIKRELEIALEKCGLGTISDIRPVTTGYGKEISKYALKIGVDIDDEDLKEMIVHLKGKRMVSKFGNCYGVKEVEELDSEEVQDYVSLGSLNEVIRDCFNSEKINKKIFWIVMGMVKIGLIDLEFIEDG
jgi:hypothetical protein